MKKNTILLFALAVMIGNLCTAQENDRDITESAVTSLEVTVEEISELDTLDWDEMFQIFEGNRDDQTIEVRLVFDGDLSMKSDTSAKIKLSNLKISLSGIQSEKEELLSIIKEKTAKAKQSLIRFQSK